MKFGKKAPEYDERTIQLSRYMDHSFHAPTKFDFDKGRRPFDLSDWGTLKNKSDVIAAQAHHLLRLGRIDQRRTIPLDQGDVIRRYKKISGTYKLGDENDTGLTMLRAFKAWKSGWMMRGRTYDLAMYGEIYPNERDLIRTLIYVFRGVHFGFWLPKGIEGSYREWDWDGENGEEWKPGGLGGFAAYCKAYTPDGYEVIVDGLLVKVTNEFVEKFCDECWVAVESFDYWASQILDLRSLFGHYPTLRPGNERGGS